MTDVRLTELLCSKLCHDLVGPVGAIGNGMELLMEEDMGMSDEALELTAHSTRRASAVLQFFRIAYGLGQTERRQDPNFLRELSEGYLADTRVSLDWPEEARAGQWPDGAGKLILNMVVLAQEALPVGGTVRIGITDVGGGSEISTTAQGRDAGFHDATREALADDALVDELTPRTVHGYFTRLLARRYGGDLQISAPDTESLRISSLVTS